MGFSEEDKKNLDVIARAIDPDKDWSPGGPPFTFRDMMGGFIWLPAAVALLFFVTDGVNKLSTVLASVAGGIWLFCFILDKIFGFPGK